VLLDENFKVLIDPPGAFEIHFPFMVSFKLPLAPTKWQQPFM
jgi:hypothetical protein